MAAAAAHFPPPFDPQPVVLEDEHVRLEPLLPTHADDLLAAGRDEDISAFTFRPPFTRIEVVRRWIGETLAAERDGEQIPFAIIARSGASGNDRAVGSTRFLDIRRDHRGLEIGYTWVGPKWQRTAVNTACKRLLLVHAFETLGAVRVTFKTDLRNERSQRSLERLGAVREGVLRKHMILPDGFVRDSVYYGITAEEWPAVKTRLTEMLGRGAGPAAR